MSWFFFFLCFWRYFGGVATQPFSPIYLFCFICFIQVFCLDSLFPSFVPAPWMFPCSPLTCRAQPSSTPPASSWVPHPVVAQGRTMMLSSSWEVRRHLSQGGEIHPTEGTAIPQPLNHSASSVWAGSCGDGCVLEIPGQQDHVHVGLYMWVDGCAYVVVSPSLLNSLTCLVWHYLDSPGGQGRVNRFYAIL